MKIVKERNYKPYSLGEDIFNRISGVGAGLGGMFLDVWRAPQRAGVELGLTITGRKKFTPRTPMERGILGGEILDTESTGYKTMRDLGFDDKTSKQHALGLGGIFLSLDLLPPTNVGSKVGKNLVSAITKMDKAEDIAKVLKSARVPEDLAASYAEKFSRTFKSSEVELGLRNLNRIMKETRLNEVNGISDITRYDGELPTRTIALRSKKNVIDTIEEIKRKNTAGKINIAKAEDRNIFANRVDEIQRKGELNLLKQGIKIRTAKDRVIQTLKDRAFDIKIKKNSIYEYAKDTLNKDELTGSEWKTIAREIARAETDGQTSKAFRDLLKFQESSMRRGFVADIEKSLDGVENLPIKQQDKIAELMQGTSIKGMSQKTIDKVTKLKGFLEREPEAKFMFGRKTFTTKQKIEKLGNKPISEMKLGDLAKLKFDIERLASAGKFEKETRKNIDVLEKQNLISTIKKESVNLDVISEEKLLVEDGNKFIDKFYQTYQSMKGVKKSFYSPDIAFELMDNGKRRGINYRTFKEPIDSDILTYRKLQSGIVDNYFAVRKEIEKKYGKKFTNVDFQKIMLYAVKMQEGGRSKLLKSGVEYLLPKGVTIDSITLSPQQMEYYVYGRKIFDGLFPLIDKTMRESYGTKLGKVDNYWSMHTDFDRVEDTAETIKKDFLTSRTEQGFTKQRKFGSEQMINFNAEEVLLKHINDSTYFVSTQKNIKRLSEIARMEEYSDAVGKEASQWVREWLDLMARKGVPSDYKPNWFNGIIRNIGHGILGFSLSPIVKQPIAKLTSSVLLGKHTFIYDGEYLLNNLHNIVNRASLQQKFRTFDDQTFIELAKNKKLAQWQKMGYLGMKYMDSITANNVWYAAYRKSLSDRKIKFNLSDFKAGKFDDEAIKDADLLTRRTQGSGEFKDAAAIFTGKNANQARIVFMFQRFVLNQFLLLSHDVVGKTLLKEKNIPKAMAMAMLWMSAPMAESYATSAMAQLFSSDDYAKKEKEKEVGDRILQSLVTSTPIVNNVYSMSEYSGSGLPALDIVSGLPVAAKSMVSGEEPETRQKGSAKVLELIGDIGGVSGSKQVGQIIRKKIEPTSKKRRKKTRVTRRRN